MTDETSADEDNQQTRGETVWILVDHSARKAALVPVAQALEGRGMSVEMVTITEVLGSVAREALAGGAERLLRGLRIATSTSGEDEDLVRAIRRQQPDVLVVTDARYVRAIGVLENLSGVETLQVGLIEDFHVDRAWLNGQLHGFVVPDEIVESQLIDRGISEDRVERGGPALRPEFDVEIDADAARKELGLGEDELVVLVRADGFDKSTLEKLVFQCTLCDREARFVFHHNGDGAIASTLRRAADQYGLKAAMFGRVRDLERYFAAADAVLARDDDDYRSELLDSGTPGLFVSRRPDEDGDADALAERGLADELSDVGQLGTVLDRFLDREHLDQLREQLDSWDGAARHDALVSALEAVVDGADQWRRPAAPETTEEPTEDDDAEAVEEPTPFEPIGEGGEATQPKDRGDGKRTEQRRPEYSSLSRAEAKEQLAELILKEREVERRLKELEKQQERWRDRLQLAREWNEDDLAAEAKSILRGYIDDAEPLEKQLDDIGRQKQKLKKAARGPRAEGTSGEPDADFDDDRASGMEDRFRQMEVDRDLEGLKDRIRRELGE